MRKDLEPLLRVLERQLEHLLEQLLILWDETLGGGLKNLWEGSKKRWRALEGDQRKLKKCSWVSEGHLGELKKRLRVSKKLPTEHEKAFSYPLDVNVGQWRSKPPPIVLCLRMIALVSEWCLSWGVRHEWYQTVRIVSMNRSLSGT